MPWGSKTVIETRQQFVTHAQSPHANIRALCRHFHISPKTGYKILNRFRLIGEDGLRDRSRRPQHHPTKTSDAIEQAVVALRHEHPSWGGRRLAKELRAQGMVKVPAPSTITTILSRHGFLQYDRPLDPLVCLAAVPRKRMVSLLHKELSVLVSESEFPVLLDRLVSKRGLERRRAIVVLAGC